MQRVFGIILLFILISFGVFASIVMRYDVERREVNRQVALLQAQAKLAETQTENKIKLIQAEERLEKAKTKNDPSIREAVKHAEKTKLYLSAWLPVYLPFVLSAAAGGTLAVYISFRLVEFQHGELRTPVRAIDAPKLALAAMQVQALEATQGMEAVKFASELQTRNMTALGTFARGVRGLLGRDHGAGHDRQVALPPVNMPVQHVPSFSDLLNAGKFQAGSPLLFGFQESGSPKMGTWQDAYSLGIAGLSGYGKSATIRFLMSESLLTGAVGEFFVIDPHYPHEKSLLASLGELKQAKQLHYVENSLDTMDLLSVVNARIDRRLKGEEASDPLLVVVIDELIPAVKTFPAISSLVERIGTESRKAGVYGIFASQSWNGDKTGGTTARDNLTALLVHRMKPKQANTLLQDSTLAKQVTRLQPGQVLFSPTSADPELLTVPYCSLNDMPEVVKRLTPFDMTTAAPKLEDAKEFETVENDTVLIQQIKQRFPENNELARKIGYDKAQVSRALNYGVMSASLRRAFASLL